MCNGGGGEERKGSESGDTATVYIAQKANAALTLPVFLAGTYATQHRVQVNTVFQITNSARSFDGAAELITIEGDKLVDTAVLPYILQLLGSSGQGQGRQSEVEEWLDRLWQLTASDFKALDTPIKELESHLTLRSYIVGHAVTLADIAIWGALRGNRVIVGLRRKSQNINRWFSFIESAYPWLPEAVAAFQVQARQNKAAAKPKGANYNIDLENTRNGIVCRFLPEPSGYLHIGHASRGVLICHSILYDLSLLGITPDCISYSSDYFQQMYDACTELIKHGKAYADNTVKDVMQDQRKNGIANACREMSEGKQWCIRAKISVDDINKALRDPVIYPTYDFCAPCLDSIEGVTHALRTNEYRDHFSRLNFIRTVLSKRKLTIFVDEGVVWGWDDPRMPTVRGICRRGCIIPALREFILRQGPSQNIKNIDSIAARYTAIPKPNAVTAIIDSVDETSSFRRPKHNNNPDDNSMNWGNAIVLSKTSDVQTGRISALKLKLDLMSDLKKTGKKITWLAKEPRKMIPVELFSFNHLINKDKLDKDEELTSCLTKPSHFLTEAWADCNVLALSADDIIQSDRTGSYRADRAYRDGQPLALFNIPTGKGA
ncbi:hypothetical protein BDV19DRAFT_399541 [Aspergillus venezuelensis]